MLLNTEVKLTKRGQIMKTAKQVYLSNDIPCAISNCVICDQQNFDTYFDPSQIIYIIDTDVLEQNLDIIQQTELIQNVLLLQSSINHFNKFANKSIQLHNFIDSTYTKQIYVYQNEFSTVTQSSDNDPILLLYSWYTSHYKDIQICIISNNYKLFQIASQNYNIQTIHDFIKKYYKPGDDLFDFLGFDNSMQQEFDQSSQIFQEHLEIQQAVSQIKQGLLFEGKLSVDRNDLTQAKIRVKAYNLEIKITGKTNQNRALHGDRVAVQLLPENKWSTYTEFQLEDDLEVQDDNQSIALTEVQFIQKVVENAKNRTPEGIVVSILERVDKQYCGHITDNLFYPADSRYPAFNLVNIAQSFLNKKLIVIFQQWPTQSNHPIGRVKQILGQAGDLYVEGNVILLEHEVEIREFSKQVLACLPQENFQISEEERAKRWDLTHLPVASIDPVGCRDIDDALHCIVLPNGNYEIGCHIADVSYFVKPNTAIDKEAQHRCTTVYLVDRRTDMLPKLLTEKLCSLVSGVERLAFSVIWEFDMEANIVNVQFGKSIIHSKASLHYQQAQEIHDNQNDKSELAESIRRMMKITRLLKNKRTQSGALTLASSQVKFSFDDETHNPTDVRLYPTFETNSLVEELMLQANISVSEQILQRFPGVSVLRRHQQPKQKEIQELQILLTSLGFEFEYQTSKRMNECLDGIISKTDPFFNKLVRIMTTRCMNEALYVCTADYDQNELFHYGLAAKLYTHFTSPIRRYADVLVHRLLAASIDLESLPAYMNNKIKIGRICDKMNQRHRMARFASRASSDYHTKQPYEDAIITGLNPKGCQVMLPQFGLEGFVEQKIEKVGEGLFLCGKIRGKEIRMFEHIKVKVQVALKHYHKQITLEYQE